MFYRVQLHINPSYRRYQLLAIDSSFFFMERLYAIAFKHFTAFVFACCVLETFISALLADSLSIVASRKNAMSIQHTQNPVFLNGFARPLYTRLGKSIVDIMHPRSTRSSNSKVACQRRAERTETLVNGVSREHRDFPHILLSDLNCKREMRRGKN